MTGNRRRWVLVIAATGALCLVAALAGATKRTLSDACFIVGAASLVVGLAKLVRKTGSFFFALDGFKQFIALVAKGTWRREDPRERYHEYRSSVERDSSYRFPLLLALAALAASATIALL